MKKILYMTLILCTTFLLVSCVEDEIEVTYTVNFNHSTGQSLSPVTINEGDFLTPPAISSRSGYVFDDWYIDNTYTTPYDFDLPVTSDMTLYAHWIETFQVTFESNGGSAIIPQTITSNETVSSVTPVKMYYDFTGWYTDEALTNPFNSETPITSDITLYAGWDFVNHTYDTVSTYVDHLQSLNPYTLTQNDAKDYYDLISDTLYKLTYDWDLAIADGYASSIGDFSQIASLPINYMPSMAASEPTTDDGLVWEVSLQEGLTFNDGTTIDANTFISSYQFLLDPDTSLDAAEIMFGMTNAYDYFMQGSYVMDDLQYLSYMVDGVEYQRAWGLYGHVIGHEDWLLYYPALESDYSADALVGPGGSQAYLEYWGNNYSALANAGYPNETGNTLYLENETGETFEIYTVDGISTLYAPEAGWTLHGEPVPVVTDANPDDFVAYASTHPAYMNEAGDTFAPVTENGIPVDGELLTYPTVDFEDVGIKALDDYTLEFTFNNEVHAAYVKSLLSDIKTSVVHPSYHDDPHAYGDIDGTIYSFGPYNVIENNDHSIYFSKNESLTRYEDTYLVPIIELILDLDGKEPITAFKEDIIDVLSSYYSSNTIDDGYLIEELRQTIFFLRFNGDYGFDEDTTNDNPFLDSYALRQALFFSINRELINQFDTGSSPYVFNASFAAGKYQPYRFIQQDGVLDTFESLLDNTNGYDPTKAVYYFDIAYQSFIDDGIITDGDKVTLTLLERDYEWSSTISRGEMYESLIENVLGTTKFDIIVDAKPSDQYNIAFDAGEFDIVYAGLSGTNDGVLFIYSLFSLADPSWLNEEIQISLPQITDIIHNGDIETFDNEWISTHIDDDIFIGSYDELYTLYKTFISQNTFLVNDDLTTILEMFSDLWVTKLPTLPLGIEPTIKRYKTEIRFKINNAHPILGYGGFEYMYIETDES